MKSEVEPARPIVVVMYHMFPHYRAPIVRELSKSDKYKFEFYGSHEEISGIKPFSGDASVEVKAIKFRPKGSGGTFGGYLRPLLRKDVSAVVLIGNPNFHQTWIAAIAARACGKAVLFWTHGWLKREALARRLLRNTYFGLSNRVMVYADRARDLAERSGFDPNKVSPIYNSLDWDKSVPLFERLEQINVDSIRADLGLPARQPIIVCTARLTKLCRFDLLLEAASQLKVEGLSATIVLIGDGPERSSLETLAASLGLDVRFTGGIYDEERLASYIYAADVTVSPGKIGLTAMHSLTYGTPVVTHGDLDQQMPEVEAVIPGRTGEFFQRGDVADLARAIRDVLTSQKSRASIRAECRNVMVSRYTPLAQRLLIEEAVGTSLQDVGKQLRNTHAG